jgi:lysophospholipase L1-like esterase
MNGASASRRWMLLASALAIPASTHPSVASGADVHQDRTQWIGTWATAPQPFLPGRRETFRNETLRLIVHTSAGGTRVRIKISNTYGDSPLLIGGAHVARRAAAADVDSGSDRRLVFLGHASTTVPARSMVVSDPVELDVPARSDLAISLFLPDTAAATTTHILALQTNYVSDSGDFSATTRFPVARTIASWPFLTGVDVEASPRGRAIVAFGSSLTDGDGSTKDANRRLPDVLAERLQQAPNGQAELGVLNLGLIGNRLLNDSPEQPELGFGRALGEAGLTRFDRDVLAQSGARFVVVALGVNDIAFPGSFTPLTDSVSAESLISGYLQLIARAHEKGIRVIGSTIPPFEGSSFTKPAVTFFTPEKEAVRQRVNAWIRSGAAFDAVVDFDLALRDPSHPTRVNPAYDSGDHLHANDAGNVAQVDAIPLALFRDPATGQ